jgi:hypothetical protein
LRLGREGEGERGRGTLGRERWEEKEADMCGAHVSPTLTQAPRRPKLRTILSRTLGTPVL